MTQRDSSREKLVYAWQKAIGRFVGFMSVLISVVCSVGIPVYWFFGVATAGMAYGMSIYFASHAIMLVVSFCSSIFLLSKSDENPLKLWSRKVYRGIILANLLAVVVCRYFQIAYDLPRAF